VNTAAQPAHAAVPSGWRFPSVLIDRLRLADGRELIVRPVLAFDAAAEQDFVRALSAGSRQRRFHVGLRELPPALLRAMTEVDHDAHVAIVAEAFGDNDEATIVADARYVRGPTAELAHDEAEFAIAVADAWQGAGLGRALMKHLARHAARHGITRLVGDVQQGNAAMFAIADSLGGRLVASPNGPGVIRTAFDLFTSTRRAPA
jgi:GNAT superfamily N-acetyltransferase